MHETTTRHSQNLLSSRDALTFQALQAVTVDTTLVSSQPYIPMDDEAEAARYAQLEEELGHDDDGLTDFDGEQLRQVFP